MSTSSLGPLPSLRFTERVRHKNDASIQAIQIFHPRAEKKNGVLRVLLNEPKQQFNIPESWLDRFRNPWVLFLGWQNLT
jgi:hypothetical protein